MGRRRGPFDVARREMPARACREDAILTV